MYGSQTKEDFCEEDLEASRCLEELSSLIVEAGNNIAEITSTHPHLNTFEGFVDHVFGSDGSNDETSINSNSETEDTAENSCEISPQNNGSQPSEAKMDGKDPANDETQAGKPDLTEEESAKFRESIGTGVVASFGILELIAPLLFSPISSMKKFISNERQLGELLADFEEVDAQLSFVEKIIKVHENSLNELSRHQFQKDLLAGRRQVEKGREVLHRHKKTVEEREMESLVDISPISKDCQQIFEALRETKSTLKTTIAAIYAAVSTAPNMFGGKFSLSSEAAMIADRKPRSDFGTPVLLSNAGEDKKSFAIPLRERLAAEYIGAFVDMKNLKTGEDVPEGLKDIIASAKVGVFILSPEFAAKKWTMLELISFLHRVRKAKENGEKPPKIIPIFHRLSLSECSDPLLPWTYSDVFKKNGFPQMAGKGQTSVHEMVSSLSELSNQFGVERRSHAAAESQDVAETEEQFLDRVAAKIKDVMNEEDSALEECEIIVD